MDESDHDYNLIPKIVANVCLPAASDAAQFDWDPLSRQSTKQVSRVHDAASFSTAVHDAASSQQSPQRVSQSPQQRVLHREVAGPSDLIVFVES